MRLCRFEGSFWFPDISTTRTGEEEFRSSGVQEFRSSGVQEFRSSGVQEFRSSGVQEFRMARIAKLQAAKRLWFENLRSTQSHPTQAPELLQLLELLNSFSAAAVRTMNAAAWTRMPLGDRQCLLFLREAGCSTKRSAWEQVA